MVKQGFYLSFEFHDRVFDDWSCNLSISQELLKDFEFDVKLLVDLLKSKSSLLHVEDHAYVLRNEACSLPKCLFDFFYGKPRLFAYLA
jgi:hypothetical protein